MAGSQGGDEEEHFVLRQGEPSASIAPRAPYRDARAQPSRRGIQGTQFRMAAARFRGSIWPAQIWQHT